MCRALNSFGKPNLHAVLRAPAFSHHLPADFKRGEPDARAGATNCLQPYMGRDLAHRRGPSLCAVFIDERKVRMLFLKELVDRAEVCNLRQEMAPSCGRGRSGQMPLDARQLKMPG